MASSAAGAASDRPLLQEAAPEPNRITIGLGSGASGERVFKLDGQEVVLLGGNYVFKTQPYFPPVEVVSANAKQMAEGARTMTYTPPPASDGTPRPVKPCVRLGCMLEGAMPNQAGPVDPTWAASLEATIKAFAEQGVYVFLEVHMDVFSTTNGGDGLPWWIGDYMQSNANCCSASGDCCCCCCCCGCGTPSYIANPQNPLALVFPNWLASSLGVRLIETAQGEPSPWAPYAIGADQGNPASMNVGNLSMRLNNNDSAWSAGTLGWTKQVHNFAPRFYQCASDAGDRKAIFEPYLEHIRYLSRKWEQHWNVVAVELLNEPPLAGLPNACQMLRSRRDLFSLYAAVLEGLDQSQPAIRAPIALQDGYGSLADAATLMKVLSLVPIPGSAKRRLKEWGERNQMILSFHYYPGSDPFAHNQTFDKAAYVAMAKKESADLMASSPVWLSEYWASTAQGMADALAEFTDAGCPCTTYWQYVDTDYTQTGGWYKYPPEVLQQGVPITPEGEVNAKAWAEYEKTVANGTYWGGMVCGADGGQSDVLSKVKAASSASA